MGGEGAKLTYLRTQWFLGLSLQLEDKLLQTKVKFYDITLFFLVLEVGTAAPVENRHFRRNLTFTGYLNDLTIFF